MVDVRSTTAAAGHSICRLRWVKAFVNLADFCALDVKLKFRGKVSRKCILSGFDMLQARYSNAKLKEEEVKTYADDISITPLAIPMLCGPGAIANAIMLMDDASTFTLKGTLIGIIALVYFITFLILQASTRLVRILGETGNNVMMRLMGLILMVIAVECFVSGLKPILIDILREAMG